MAEIPGLTLAYLQQRPESAARALERLVAADAAEVLRRVPARIAAPVVGAMNSVRAAQCAAELPADLAGTLCSELSWADAAALLRRLDGQAREQILDEMPEKAARRFRRSLDYPGEVVGAWIEFEAPAIVEDRDVGDAMQLLAQLPACSGSHLLLTDVARCYTGMVPLAGLLSAAPTSALTAIVQRDVQPLRDAASLASVMTNPGWELATMLPVVSHRGELLGGLGRRTLQKALQHAVPSAPDERVSLIAEMLRAYLQSGEGLLRLLMNGAVRENQADGGTQQ